MGTWRETLVGSVGCATWDRTPTFRPRKPFSMLRCSRVSDGDQYLEASPSPASSPSTPTINLPGRLSASVRDRTQPRRRACFSGGLRHRQELHAARSNDALHVSMTPPATCICDATIKHSRRCTQGRCMTLTFSHPSTTTPS